MTRGATPAPRCYSWWGLAEMPTLESSRVFFYTSQPPSRQYETQRRQAIIACIKSEEPRTAVISIRRCEAWRLPMCRNYPVRCLMSAVCGKRNTVREHCQTAPNAPAICSSAKASPDEQTDQRDLSRSSPRHSQHPCPSHRYHLRR
jgi:hypothetical protein